MIENRWKLGQIVFSSALHWTLFICVKLYKPETMQQLNCTSFKPIQFSLFLLSMMVNFHWFRLNVFYAFNENWNAINEFMSFIIWNCETNYQWHAHSSFSEWIWIVLIMSALEISIFIRKNIFFFKNRTFLI